MAGHSKWANIRHKKAKIDAKRGKIWTKCSRAIIVAARNGPDPEMNLALRYAVDEAKAANMPKDTIARAIARGSGVGGDPVVYEEIRYEGYGPGGVAIIADVLTDNRTRTAPEMRLIFGKHGGNLGATGCVSYNFEARGVITIDEQSIGEEAMMELALEAGADDVSLEDGSWTITTDPTQYLGVKEVIERAGVEMTSSELTMIPNTTTMITGDDVATVIKLIDALEDHDDVQKVYTNLDASPEELAAAMGE
ncbi:MAG: YebC/PmpR family DNA-binding transcriptional regulator [Phycisphaerales bacterium]